MKKQDKFAGAMKRIFNDHKKEIKLQRENSGLSNINENKEQQTKGSEFSTTKNLPLLQNEDVATKVIPEEDEHEKLE